MLTACVGLYAGAGLGWGQATELGDAGAPEPVEVPSPVMALELVAVAPGGVAEEAGLQAGDQIAGVNGRWVWETWHLQQARAPLEVAAYRPGAGFRVITFFDHDLGITFRRWVDLPTAFDRVYDTGEPWCPGVRRLYERGLESLEEQVAAAAWGRAIESGMPADHALYRRWRGLTAFTRGDTVAAYEWYRNEPFWHAQDPLLLNPRIARDLALAHGDFPWLREALTYQAEDDYGLDEMLRGEPPATLPQGHRYPGVEAAQRVDAWPDVVPATYGGWWHDAGRWAGEDSPAPPERSAAPPGAYDHFLFEVPDLAGDFEWRVRFTARSIGEPHPRWPTQAHFSVLDADQIPLTNFWRGGPHHVLLAKLHHSDTGPFSLSVTGFALRQHYLLWYRPPEARDAVHELVLTRLGDRGEIWFNGAPVLAGPLDPAQNHLVFWFHNVGMDIRFESFELARIVRSDAAPGTADHTAARPD